VIGEPETVKPVGTVAETEVTDPPPVPAPIAVRKLAASRAETVLSALTRRKLIAPGFVRVKRFEPTVVAPRLVRAPAAVVAPVPPEANGRAWVRVKLLIVVVAKVAPPAIVTAPLKAAFWSVVVPVRAGATEKTALPEPVSFVSELASSAEVIEEAAVPKSVPEVGRVTFVTPVVVRVRLLAPERMKLLAPKVMVDGRIGVPVKVGEVAKTRLPEPVSFVTAAARLAEDGVARKVATLAPRPETPVVIGRPVALVKVAALGVPRFGVVNTGELVNATTPVPLSSLRRAANCAELEKAAERPSDEVAIWVKVFPAPPMRSWFGVVVDRPVPPRVAASVPVVSLKAIPKVLVALILRVLPLHARLVPAVILVLGVL
jgi:hypothetical protein